MITRYWTGRFFVSGQCLVHTHCFACWLLLRSSLFCVVNDNDFVFFCLCLSLRRSTEKASILLRFWDLMQPGVTDGMIPDFCILNCCAAASYYRTALYIWKHPSARLPSRNTVSHCNDSVYTHTENVNIICKTGCGLDCKKRLKKTAKKAEKGFDTHMKKEYHTLARSKTSCQRGYGGIGDAHGSDTVTSVIAKQGVR